MMKSVNLGYKYRLYPKKEQERILDHQMFVYNQAYNICLNLWQKEGERNKKLEKESRKFRKSVSYDGVVKRALKLRKISFSTVVTQQARINLQKAVKKAFSKEVVAERQKAIAKAQTPKDKAKAAKLGFPKFHSSKDVKQSFVWNNQAVNINDKNMRFKLFRILKQNIELRCHRELPVGYKLASVTISKDATGYYASFNIEFQKEIGVVVLSNNIDISKSLGVDMNAYNFATSIKTDILFESINNITSVQSGHLVDNGSSNRKSLRDSKIVKMLERKQSRRALKAKNTKTKLGKNHKRTQERLNSLQKKTTNKKTDLYHKISSILSNSFDMIAVEDLKLKNQMTKSAKGNEITPGRRVKQKSGLNKTILRASFYQFSSMLEYKQSLNDKLFVRVDPKNTSNTCLECGNIDKKNRLKQDKFKCIACGYETNPDIQAALHIEYRGLQSFGLGTSLVDLKHKAFRSETLVSAS